MANIESVLENHIGKLWDVPRDPSDKGTVFYTFEQDYAGDEREQAKQAIKATLRRLHLKGTVESFWCGASYDKPCRIYIRITKKQAEANNKTLERL